MCLSSHCFRGRKLPRVAVSLHRAKSKRRIRADVADEELGGVLRKQPMGTQG